MALGLTISGVLIEPLESGGVNLREGTLRVEGDRIVSVDDGLVDAPDVGGAGCLISPGFVDAHLHLPQFDSIGVAGLELLEWLERVIFPAEEKWADTAYARSMTERVGRQLLRAGTTSIAAYATSHVGGHAGGTQAAIDVLGEMGFSGYVGQVLMDQQGPPGLLVPAAEAIQSCESLIGNGRIEPSVNPRFAVSCSMELMKAGAELAKRKGWWLQTHLAETHAEIETVRQLHGRAYVSVYAKAGMLTERTLLAHGVHLSEDDHAKLRESGSTIVHCPTANRFLTAGSMNWSRTAVSGVRMALGSDVAGGPDRSMVRVARAMLENRVAKRSFTGREEPNEAFGTASQAWWQITRGNAGALGLADVGSLAVGARADFLVIRPDLSLATASDPLGPIVYGWDDRWIERVFVAGRLAAGFARTAK